MARAVIADSDEEEDLGYSPPSRSPTKPNAPVTRSSDLANHSASTDPAFFQSVFDEQSEAVRQQQTGKLHPESQYQDRQSRAGSAPPPAAGDEYGPSSLMSTDPLHGREDDVNGQGPATKSRTVPPKQALATADDPWEIPSSLEEARGIATSQRKSQERKRDGKSRSKQRKSRSSPHRVLESPGGNAEHDRGSRKRRRISAGQSPTQEAEKDIDLVRLPSTQGVDKDFQALTPSTMPPPTLPISRSSFAVATTKAPGGSKRQEYQSLMMGSDEEPSQDQGPSRPAPGAAAITRSSGSATNINTPRSDLPSSRNLDMDLGQQYQDTTEGLESNNPPGHWNSSPDEIAAIGPAKSDLGAAKRMSKDNRTTDPVTAEAASGPKTRRTPADTHKRDDEGEDSDFVERPVKPKKQRGRPRKSARAAEASRVTSPAPSSQAADGRSSVKPKKKRGRPRKEDQQPAAVRQSSASPDGDMRDAANSDQAIKREGGAVQEEKHATHNQDEPTDADETHFATTLGADEHPIPDTLAKDGKQEKDGPPAKPTSDEMEVSKSISKTDTSEEGREGKAAAAKLVGSLPGLSTASRPLYRVGLSKRSRIAPLLKSVRK